METYYQLPEDGIWDDRGRYWRSGRSPEWNQARAEWRRVWREMSDSDLHPYEYDLDRPARYRAPSPGLAAVLSIIPGLGHVYAGRLLAGGLWFLGTNFAYWAILVPGFLVHAICFYSAYRAARSWDGY